MSHSMNITHDGTLKIGMPKGFRVEKVIVEELGTKKTTTYLPERTCSTCKYRLYDSDTWPCMACRHESKYEREDE